jgi:hypothetical protein
MAKVAVLDLGFLAEVGPTSGASRHFQNDHWEHSGTQTGKELQENTNCTVEMITQGTAGSLDFVSNFDFSSGDTC